MSYPDPIPEGWFDAPARAWWPDYKSATCTIGHPLCMAGYAEIMLIRRRARIAAAAARQAIGGARAFRFTAKADGTLSTSELIWRHVAAHGRLDECEAAEMVGCKPGSLHQRVGNAIVAGALVRVMVAGCWGYELGAVVPVGVAA